MLSMTGYGQVKGPFQGLQIEVSVKSVNNRFLEIRFHLPKEYYFLEPQMRKMIEHHFHRGSLDIYILRKGSLLQKNRKVLVNDSLADSYFQALKKLSTKFKLQSHIHPEVFLRIPEVFVSQDSDEVSAAEQKWILTEFKKSLQKCVIERKREGNALQKDLLKLHHDLESKIEIMHKMKTQINEEMFAKYKERIETKWKNLEMDQQRLFQEVALQIEKSDIDEELSRLKEHLKNYKNILNGTESEGKKLEFYTQELLREINTIGSKSPVFKLTELVVESKTILEKIREQIQNVE